MKSTLPEMMDIKLVNPLEVTLKDLVNRNAVILSREKRGDDEHVMIRVPKSVFRRDKDMFQVEGMPGIMVGSNTMSGGD